MRMPGCAGLFHLGEFRESEFLASDSKSNSPYSLIYMHLQQPRKFPPNK